MSTYSIVRLATAAMAGALLLGCATRFDIGDADTRIAPPQAAADIDSVRGRVVAWGGMIVSSRNLTDRTQLEILGYPLDRQNRPDLDAKPFGRFLAVYPGYLETADFKEGRLVTVVGRLTGTHAGQVGEAHYVYPLVNAERIQLWSLPGQSREPRVHFGIGVGVTR
jgi:outer membrane lipoprotein